jgi:hypothetical protein
MTTELVPTLDFSQAKTSLSSVMDSVYHNHQPYLVSRHRGLRREQIVLLARDVLDALLCSDKIEVEGVVDGGEVTLSAPRLGVLGFGESLDEAVADLLVELRDYAAAFFHEPDRYRGNVRDGQYATLLRFALTPPDEQKGLLAWDEPVSQRPTAAR